MTGTVHWCVVRGSGRLIFNLKDGRTRSPRESRFSGSSRTNPVHLKRVAVHGGLNAEPPSGNIGPGNSSASSYRCRTANQMARPETHVCPLRMLLAMNAKYGSLNAFGSAALPPDVSFQFRVRLGAFTTRTPPNHWSTIAPWASILKEPQESLGGPY